DQRRRQQHAEADAGGRRDAVRAPGRGGVVARGQGEQGSGGGAQRRARGQALQGAGGEQPPSPARPQGQDAGGPEQAQPREQARPAADLVRDAPGEQQAREHAERVGRVDQGERERREVPQHGVRVVQRGGRQRGQQAEADDGRGEGVGGGAGEGAPPRGDGG